jgi:hypothetical protein
MLPTELDLHYEMPVRYVLFCAVNFVAVKISMVFSGGGDGSGCWSANSLNGWDIPGLSIVS